MARNDWFGVSHGETVGTTQQRTAVGYRVSGFIRELASPITCPFENWCRQAIISLILKVFYPYKKQRWFVCSINSYRVPNKSGALWSIAVKLWLQDRHVFSAITPKRVSRAHETVTTWPRHVTSRNDHGSYSGTLCTVSLPEMYFVLLLFLNRVLCNSVWPWSHCVAKSVFELLISLPLLPKYWGCRSTSLCLFTYIYEKFKKTLRYKTYFKYITYNIWYILSIKH